MTDTIRIGDKAIQQAQRPLTSLPPRLTAQACLDILETYDPDLTVAGIAAGRQTVTVEHIDTLFEYQPLSIDDRFRFKSALVRHGILSAGKRV